MWEKPTPVFSTIPQLQPHLLFIMSLLSTTLDKPQYPIFLRWKSIDRRWQSKGQRFPFVNCHLKNIGKVEIRDGILCFFTAQMTTIRPPLDVRPLFISNLVRFFRKALLTNIAYSGDSVLELIWRKKNNYMDIQCVYSSRKLFF